jgi:acyl-coenzyme A thioesterase PaaI-like protein
MNILTHQSIDAELCGKPIKLEDGSSKVEYLTTPQMAVDGSGLVHGGFIFGLADYAAMLAVNHPNVVLGGADVKFIKPVKIDESVFAEAKIISSKGKKYIVAVAVKRESDVVFQGEFTCFVLEKHVLDV